MTFNKDLFLELCQEYDVKFSKEYSKIMFEEDDGTIRELLPGDIERIILPPKEVFSYDGAGNNDIRIGNTRIPLSFLVEAPLLPDKCLVAA